MADNVEMVEGKMLRQVGRRKEGSAQKYTADDAKRLAAMGVFEPAPKASK